MSERQKDERDAGTPCRYEERSDSDGSWEVCVAHGSLWPCDEGAMADAVIDAIEETFLGQLPSKALSYCAQEDVNAGLDALREQFCTPESRHR